MKSNLKPITWVKRILLRTVLQSGEHFHNGIYSDFFLLSSDLLCYCGSLFSRSEDLKLGIHSTSVQNNDIPKNQRKILTILIARVANSAGKHGEDPFLFFPNQCFPVNLDPKKPWVDTTGGYPSQPSVGSGWEPHPCLLLPQPELAWTPAGGGSWKQCQCPMGHLPPAPDVWSCCLALPWSCPHRAMTPTIVFWVVKYFEC